MIDIDGHMIDPASVMAVTKFWTKMGSWTSASVGFDIHLKGGSVISIRRSKETDSDYSQRAAIPILTNELTPLRDKLLLAIPKV